MNMKRLMWERGDFDECEAWHLTPNGTSEPSDVAPTLATLIRVDDGWQWELRLTLGLGFQSGSCETRAQAMSAAGDAVRSRLVAMSLLVMGAILPAPESES